MYRGVLLVVWFVALITGQVAGQQVVRRGDYEAMLTSTGLQVRYRGIPVVSGSRFTLFKPGYSGAYYSAADFTSLPVEREGSGITVTARIPEVEGTFTYRVTVADDGVQVWFTLRLQRPIEASPVELALAMFPPDQFAGGSYRLETLFGQSRPQALPLDKPQTSAAGTLQVASSVRGLTLAGRRIELTVENMGEVAPSLFDMRSRDFPPPERVYWLLYQWSAVGGEVTCAVRLQARLAGGASSPGQTAGRVVLMEGGKRMNVQRIFVQAQAPAVEKAAARELQRVFREMSDEEIPVEEGDGAGLPRQGVIYVGSGEVARERGLYTDSEYEPLGADGFILRVRGGNLLAAGGGYRGTAYAVYRLLERLGCRFYSSEMEVIPQRRTLEIRAPLNVVDNPAFEWRAMWGRIVPVTAGLSPGEWEAKVGEVNLPKMMGIPPGGFWHHTMGFLLPAENLPAEYLAEIGGQRRVTEKYLQQYCLSNPGLQKAMTDAVLKWVESDPDPVYYPVHYGDTGQFCQCERCKAWYQEHGSLTDAVIWFNNQVAQEVAKRFPGKYVTTLAYWSTRKPPVKERPLPNHLIIFCAISECQARPWAHPINLKLNVLPDLQKWIELHPLGGQGIITFEYPTTYFYLGYPYPALYAFAENLKTYRQLGIRGVYICGLTDGHLVHLYSYVMPRLMWNPDASLHRLVDEFCRAWYGRAWRPMRDYVERVHQTAMRSQSEGVMDCHAGPGQRFFREMFTREWLDRQIYPLFARAESLADSELLKRRIWREKWGVLFTDLFLHVQRGRDIVPDESEQGFTRQSSSLEDYRRIAELLRLTRAVGRDWMVEPRFRYSLTAITGFEPSRSPWWQSPNVRQLMDSPEAAYEAERRAMSDEEVRRYVVRRESPHFIADLVPNLGGRIWRLYHKGLKKDLFWRAPLEWHLVQNGHRAEHYLNFGGYEEYAGNEFGAPGWSQVYTATLSADGRSATLTAQLPSGLTLTRTITLSADQPAIDIETRLTNTSSQTIPNVVLRTHPQFSLQAGSDQLQLWVRLSDGSARTLGMREMFLAGNELPNGAWGVVVPALGVRILNEFDPSQVRQCYLYVSPYFYNLELFSLPRSLAPGESLLLKHRYVVEQMVSP